MFYHLTRFDGRALPTTCQLDQRTFKLASGGLLLEPGGGGLPGYAILQLFRPQDPWSRSRLLLLSSESYRWNSQRELEIFRDVPEDTCFRATPEAGCLVLTADVGAPTLAPGTKLTFQAAPDAAVTTEWAALFDYGPPTMRPADPARMDDEQVREVIRTHIEEEEATQVQAASERLERAWRAAVSPERSAE